MYLPLDFKVLKYIGARRLCNQADRGVARDALQPLNLIYSYFLR
jgi:hypothetical protein